MHNIMYGNFDKLELLHYIAEFKNNSNFISTESHQQILSDYKELTLNVWCISESCSEIKINLNFYFHTSLWCLKRFYEGL